jgi:hypothetical protein
MFTNRCPTAACDMQQFWYTLTKASEIKYGVEASGSLVQLTRNGAV